MPLNKEFHQKLHTRARDLRNQATPAEKKLWEYLSGKKFDGLKFRRQHVIDPFIVDFYCPSRKLIIEVDGGTHLETTAEDKNREFFLINKGYQIVRFYNNEVMENTFDVIEKIRQICKV